MTDAATSPVAVAQVDELAARLADLGMLIAPDPHLDHVGT